MDLNCHQGFEDEELPNELYICCELANLYSKDKLGGKQKEGKQEEAKQCHVLEQSN